MRQDGVKTILSRLRRLNVAKLKSLILKREQCAPTRGVPPDITFDTLAEVCLQLTGETLTTVSFLKKSYWTADGVYWIWLKTSRGRHQSLIYKNKIKRLNRAATLVATLRAGGKGGFSSEYLIYKHARDTLAAYLPAAYLCSEVIPGQHYQFLLEDLAGYREATSPEDSLRAVMEFSAIHSSMDEWASAINQEELLQYHGKLPMAFKDYVKTTLESYTGRAAKTMAAEVCGLLPEAFALYENEDIGGTENNGLVHGDFHPYNILFSENHLGRTKVIDWEDAGIGNIYIDLASLLSFAAPEVERQALELFSRQDERRSPEEHTRLYLLYKMRRAFIDAAFFAGRILESPDADDIEMSNGVEAQLHRVFRSYRELARLT